MPKRRKRPRAKREKPTPKVVHDASLVQRLFERGYLSPRQYEVAASVRDAAMRMGPVFSQVAITDLRTWRYGAIGRPASIQEDHAAQQEALAKAMEMAAIHPKGQRVLIAVCVEDTPCRTLDRRFGWRNGTAAEVLGNILTVVWEMTRPPKTPEKRGTMVGTHGNRVKGSTPRA
jgi:hypothetical protein